MEKFPGHTTLELLREIQRTMAENRIQPEQFEGRIIFMSMYNDIDWISVLDSPDVKAHEKDFFGPGTEEK